VNAAGVRYPLAGLVLLLISAAWTCASAAPQVTVRIEGISGELEQNVRASLSIAQYTDWGAEPAATIRRLNGEAPRQIRRALEPYGYFSPQVDANLTRDGDNWTATYRIQPGEPVTVERVVVRIEGAGANDPALASIARSPPIRTGAPLRQSEYTQTKRALQQVAADHGYLDAEFARHVLHVDPAQHSAQVLLVFRTGPRYRFGEVTIHQGILNPGFVHRYVHIQPGEPYSAGKLSDLQSRLSSSGYFSSVSVTPEKDRAGQDRRVPVTVTAQPAKRNHYSLGLGYGTDTGPRLRFGWENRRVNRRGHRFRFDARLSRIATEANARYIVPLADPTSDRLVFSATDNRRDYGDTVGYLLGLGVSRITRVDGWQQDAYVNVGRYRSDLAPGTLVSRLVMPGIRYSRIVAQPPGVSAFGYSINADVHGAARALASDDTFARADLSVHVVIPLGPGEVVLRGEIGAIADSNFDHLPVAERFFAGGENSVRGYAYQSIGPRNAAGQVVGGRYLKTGSVEYDWRIVGNWGVAAFFDAGTAANSFTAPPEKGIGLGARYYTPVGAVRVDLAHPIAHPELGYVRLHIGIGLSL